jgi:hypothetical protein
MLSVDGDRPVAIERSGTDERSFTTTHTSPGIHEVKVWRTQKTKPTVAIAGSEYASHYCVGSCPAIPHGHLSLSSAGSSFAAVSGGTTPSDRAVTLSSSGIVRLNWAARTDQSWCRLNRYNGSLAVGDSTTLTVSVDARSRTGSSVCTVIVSDSNADNSPQTIIVN